MAKAANIITIYGRLSFPTFSYDQAVIKNQKSDYPKADTSQVEPDFNLVLDQAQHDKFVAHVLNEYLPFVEEQDKKKEKGGLDPKSLAKVRALIESGDWSDQPPYIPIKEIGEKTLKLAPEGVSSLKINGNRGVDVEQKAIVNDESELVVPDPDLLKFPVIKPIHQTVHSLYAGCYTAATLNLYAYMAGKTPGFKASASTAVFKADGERFGGGVAVDEDDIFDD